MQKLEGKAKTKMALGDALRRVDSFAKMDVAEIVGMKKRA